MSENVFNEKEYYREKIVEMVGKIENPSILEIVYGFVRRGYKEEKAGSK